MPSFEDFWDNIMIPNLERQDIVLDEINKTLFKGTITNLYDLYENEEADGDKIQRQQWEIFQKSFKQKNTMTRSKKALLKSLAYFFTKAFRFLVQNYIFCEQDNGDCSAEAVDDRWHSTRSLFNLKF